MTMASTTDTPAERLAQDIVIENAGGDAVGAEAIAPDHAARAAPSPRSVPEVARPAPSSSASSGASIGASVDALREIEQLLYRQSELLDAKAWQDYIDLFTDDGVYWMPVTPEQTEWE